MQTRTGTVPSKATGIIAINDETGWTAYRVAPSEAPWVNLKLVHAEPIKGAANYWLGWHTQKKAFAQSREFFRLGASRPAVLKWATDAMLNLYPTLTEEDMAM
jgi:hypothetical protein